MHFHIITPSFNQLDYLKRCVASVRDQVAVDSRQPLAVSHEESAKSHELKAKSSSGSLIRVHHHIQDGGSTDGTVEWLRETVDATSPSRENTSDGDVASTKQYQLTFASEADEGMYDAINRGWLRAVEQTSTDNRVGVEGLERVGVETGTSDFRLPTSDIARECVLAHLNCDEQYLPGVLAKVAAFFEDHQEADVVLADMIVVDSQGKYICHRRSLTPHAWLSRICCIGMTTTTFQRASVVRDKQVLFDTSWRNIGDMVWYNALHEAGVRFRVFNELVSVFTDTGQNLNLTEEAVRERKRYANEYLFGMRRISRLVSKFYSLRRWLKEFYLTAPAEYALYWDDLSQREMRRIESPTALWHRKGPSGW